MKTLALAFLMAVIAWPELYPYFYGKYEQAFNPYQPGYTNSEGFQFFPRLTALGEFSHYAFITDIYHEWDAKVYAAVSILDFYGFRALYDASFELLTDTRTSFWFNPRTLFLGHELTVSYLYGGVHLFDAAYHHICRHEVDLYQYRSRIVDNIGLRYRMLPVTLLRTPVCSLNGGLLAANELFLYSDYAMGYRDMLYLGLRAGADFGPAEVYLTSTLTLIFKANNIMVDSTILDILSDGGYDMLSEFFVEGGVSIRGGDGKLSFFIRYETLADAMILNAFYPARLLSVGVKVN